MFQAETAAFRYHELTPLNGDDFTGNIFLQGGAAVQGNGDLLLMPRLIDYGNTQAWHRSFLRVSSGFTTSFDFTIANNNGASLGNRAQGFAFVFQSYGNKVRGDSAAGLGYNGIQESVAIG